MSKKLITGAVVAAGFAIGLAPTARADINDEVCEAVTAYSSINPYDPSDHYVLNLLQRYPNMTYNQANNLVVTAYRSVHFHDNPMCDGFTLPPNY